jgi:DNA modification methylase
MILGGEASQSIYYKDDDCVLLGGDCKDVIRAIARPKEISLILTDPPYEFIASGGGLYKNSENMEQIKDAGTDTFDFHSYIPGMVNWQDMSGDINAYFFCNKELIDKYIEVARNLGASFDVLFMKKIRYPPAHNTHYSPDIEYVMFIRSSGAIFNGALEEEWEGMYSKMHLQRSVQKNLLHPNQKPIEILKKFITVSSRPGDIILDPFAGSSQTLKAARDLGRYAIGIEKNPKWLEVGKINLSQMSLF